MEIKTNKPIPPPIPTPTYTLTVTQDELAALRYFASMVTTQCHEDNYHTALRFLAKTDNIGGSGSFDNECFL